MTAPRAPTSAGGAAPAERADRGLSGAQVEERRARGELNTELPTTGRTLAEIFRANVVTRFNAILGTLFVVVLVVGPLQDALFGVVLLSNTAIGVVQEIRTKRTLDRLAILNTPRVRAIRDGEESEIPAGDVVLDDVLALRPGDQVPVDGVVLAAVELELDEAMLTGEADLAPKRPGDPVLSGTFVASGSGIVRATAVGPHSYAARLDAAARRFSLIRSELQAGTNWILRLVTWVMVPVGVLLVATELLRTHQSVSDAIRGSVAGVGAMVPEGLVLLTSVAFAVGALRLAHRRVLVQELAAIEGLARVDVVCIDKTGTLTDAGLRIQSVEPIGAPSRQEIEDALGVVAAADPAPNATMVAIAERFAGPASWTVVDTVPFSSERKWSAVGLQPTRWWILGAPEVVGEGLADPQRRSIAASEALGRRVLLLCAASRPPRDHEGRPALPGGLAPAALLIFEERLRPEAPPTIRYLLEQGIGIKLLSGDSPRTVGAVAAQAGLKVEGEPRDARAIRTEEDLALALASANVFGRVTPEQKVAAVRALQAAGHVVAMVGDGVNDVQALKQADLGMAMGAGSPSSRAVARIVLLDNSFASVPEVLAEGRKVIANIERVANLFVTKTVYAVILAAAVVIGGVPFPFFPRHLTIVTTFTIGTPGFFLALGARAPRATTGFARRVLRFTVPAGAVAAAACFGTYSICRATSGTSAAQARTAATLALLAIGFSVLVLVLVSRPVGPARLLLVVAMVIGAGTVFAVPLSRRLLSLEMPPASVLLAAGLVALASIGALRVLLPLVSRLRPGDGPQPPGSGHDARTVDSPNRGRAL